MGGQLAKVRLQKILDRPPRPGFVPEILVRIHQKQRSNARRLSRKPAHASKPWCHHRLAVRYYGRCASMAYARNGRPPVPPAQRGLWLHLRGLPMHRRSGFAALQTNLEPVFCGFPAWFGGPVSCYRAVSPSWAGKERVCRKASPKIMDAATATFSDRILG